MEKKNKEIKIINILNQNGVLKTTVKMTQDNPRQEKFDK